MISTLLALALATPIGGVTAGPPPQAQVVREVPAPAGTAGVVPAPGPTQGPPPPPAEVQLAPQAPPTPTAYAQPAPIAQVASPGPAADGAPVPAPTSAAPTVYAQPAPQAAPAPVQPAPTVYAQPAPQAVQAPVQPAPTMYAQPAPQAVQAPVQPAPTVYAQPAPQAVQAPAVPAAPAPTVYAQPAPVPQAAPAAPTVYAQPAPQAAPAAPTVYAQPVPQAAPAVPAAPAPTVYAQPAPVPQAAPAPAIPTAPAPTVYAQPAPVPQAAPAAIAQPVPAPQAEPVAQGAPSDVLVTPVVPNLPPPPSAAEVQQPLPRRATQAPPNRLAEAALKEARQLELQLKRSETSRDAAHARTQKTATAVAKAYRKAIAADATNAEAHAGLARALSALGQHEEAQGADALAARLRTGEADPSRMVVEVGPGDEAELPYGTDLQGQTTPASTTQPAVLPVAPAVAVAAQPEPLQPADPNAAAEADALRQLLAQGHQRARAGDARGALADFEAAVRGAPESVDANLALGNALAVLGHYAHAAHYWERARELSDAPAVHRSVELNLERARQKQEALAATEAATATSAQRRAQAAATGEIEVTHHVPAEAVRAYEQGIELLQSGSPEQAVRAFSLAIREAPHFAEARIARGTTYMTLGEYGRARKDYQRALRLAPALSAPLYGLGEASLALGRERHAREYFLRYLSSEAPDVRPHLLEQARLKVAQLH